MPSRMLIRCVSATHRFWYRLTGGGMGGKLGKAPMLLLTTTGRKSGRPRTTPLLYLADGENMVVIASNGGSDRDPSWWLNLKRNPRAGGPRGEGQVRRAKKTVKAEKAGPEEKGRLWPLVTEVYPGYDEYQKRTSREIPVVVLRPE